ncbi:MAG TPA: alpha/beta fold hydrolase [Thermoanaerobaculia bacterium]|nr:alpha/beta fold hydrolase [Thermoanaerobaculia bacterium]
MLRLSLFLFALSAHAADLSVYTANYSLNGRTIAIAEWEADPSAPHVLAFTDFDSGRFGVLQEVAPDVYSLPEGVMGGREAARIRFTPMALTYNGKTFRRIPQRTVQTDGGTLWLPAGKGPFPAVVIVPAGHVGRFAAATFPNFFLSQGFAVLAYDRRSERAPFETYANDAVAAVEMLRKRRDIDPRRVGLWGHSQGGWLSIIAASKSADVAFVIDHSGMFVPAWQQELYRLGAEATADGTSASEVAAAVAYEARLMEVARTGQGWDELMHSAEGTAWRDLGYKPASLQELQQVWRDDFSFDPRPFAAGVRQPVLALFGGLDKSTPIESAANLERAMPANARLTVLFFPTADHAFLDATTGGNREIPTLKRFVPGMFDAMRRWLHALYAK